MIEAALQTEMYGGWNRFAYAPIILYGFLFAADGRFRDAIHRHSKSALVLGILAFIAYFAFSGVLREVGNADPWTDYDLGSVLLRFLKGITGWLWIVAIMGLAGGARQRTQPLDPGRKPSLMDRVAEYAREAQLPFYVLHLTPVIVIGFYVVQWNVNTLVKYLVISLSSLVVTLVLYDIGVRRTRLTRFLFGMRPEKT